jgi:hypothetical protein
VAVVLTEELAEIIIEAGQAQQRATKLLRFGVHEVQPGQPDDNATRLGMEVGDLLATLDLAVAAGIITRQAVAAGRVRKRGQLAKYLQTDGDAACVVLEWEIDAEVALGAHHV